LLARRDRARRAFLLDQLEEPAHLGAGRHAELVPADERLDGIARARAPDCVLELVRVEKRQRFERPRLRCAAETVNRARRVALRPLRTKDGAREAPQLVRDRKALDVLTEDEDERERRRGGGVRAVEQLAGPTERREQAKLVSSSKAHRRQAFELTERALAGRAGDELGVAAQKRLGFAVEPEAELVLEPYSAEKTQRVVHEDVL
jgi:hypothetical protein